MQSIKVPGRALAITALLLAPFVCHAVDGTVTINGKVTDETCTINGGASSFAVQLPTVSKSSLNAANAFSGAMPFSIALTGCANVTSGNVSVYFEPDPTKINMATGRLFNTGTAGTNVEVELLNSGMGIMDLSKSSGNQNSTAVNLSGTSATLTYYARYKSLAALTTANGVGTVAASVTYTVIYP